MQEELIDDFLEAIDQGQIALLNTEDNSIVQVVAREQADKEYLDERILAVLQYSDGDELIVRSNLASATVENGQLLLAYLPL